MLEGTGGYDGGLDAAGSLDAVTRAVRRLAADGASAVPEVLHLAVTAVPGVALTVWSADEERSVLGSAGTGHAGGYRLDVPLRHAGAVLGMLTVTSDAPLGDLALRTLLAVADMVSLALAHDVARRAAADALLDAEVERTELAHELHDGVVQTVVAARHAVSTDAPATTVGAVLARALREARRTMALLRPRAVDGDLARALRALASDLTAAGTHVTVTDDGDVPALPPALATLALRVVAAVLREDGGMLGVQLRCESAETISVTVNGVVDGMDAGVVARWRRHVLAAGGALDAQPGAVRLTLPLPADPAAAPMAPVATLGARR